MKGPPLDRVAFEKLRRIAPGQLAAQRDGEAWQARPLPEELAFKLTNRCDLRCEHCFQWGEGGYHRLLAPAERHGDLPLAVIAEVLAATRALRSNVVLWGGEPLVYREWDGLMTLLREDPRWTAICTNGTLVEERLASVLPISARVEMLVSIDGFEAEHDALRGAGAFARTLRGVRRLVAEQRAGRFLGEVSVACVIGDAMIGRLHELVRFFDDEGVGAVYVGFPWHISAATADKMDVCFAERFPARPAPAQPSWRSYTYKIAPARLDALRADLSQIDRGRWRAKVRYNPALTPDELADFVHGSDRPAQGKTRCVALQTRLDVFPSGEVVSCKFFPELTVGNLRDASVEEVWRGERYDEVRRSVAEQGLMPVCAKCNLLYRRGV